MPDRILTPAQEAVLKEERRLLGDLRVALAAFGAPAETQGTLDRSIRQLDEFFLLVVVGEFNAGKSAFINALLGGRVLQEGVTPTTAQVHVLRYGAAEAREVLEPHLHALSAPVDLLRDIHIVDTPGTNAIIREHETITGDFVPRSDLVLFVTSADRPFTETERAFMQQIRDWGKKVVVVVNKIDILESDREIAEVERFVSAHARELLGVEPEVFPVSARAALRAKESEEGGWEGSRFEPLERYIRETLDQASRIRLKLLSPLGVGLHIAGQHLAETGARLALLDEDVRTLDDVERQLRVAGEDILRGFGLRMTEIEKTLLEMERRGHDFFDETLRVGRVFDLINRSRIQQAFEEQVVGDVPLEIERRVNELIDWMVDADLRRWQAVTAHLAERRRRHKDRIVGAAEGESFHYDRTRLIDSVGREAQRVVETYDKRQEARRLSEQARNAVAASAAAGASALGLGAIVTAAATTAVADVTGVLMAGVLATVGFFIIPARRRRAKREMREKVAAMREKLGAALRTQFEQEMARGASRLEASIAPYTRFIRAEKDKLQGMQAELQRITAGLEGLRERIESL
jgi:small GTP-binding protein